MTHDLSVLRLLQYSSLPLSDGGINPHHSSTDAICRELIELMDTVMLIRQWTIRPTVANDRHDTHLVVIHPGWLISAVFSHLTDIQTVVLMRDHSHCTGIITVVIDPWTFVILHDKGDVIVEVDGVCHLRIMQQILLRFIQRTHERNR
jgi:hypothetical protein